MLRTPIVVCLSLLAACSDEGPTGPSTGATGTPLKIQGKLLKLVPPDALVTLHLPDLAGTWDRLGDTVFGDLFAEVDFEGRLAQFETVYTQKVTPAVPSPAAGAPDWSDIERVIRSMSGEVVVALLDLDGFDARVPEVRLLAGVSVTGAGTPAKKLLGLLCRLAGNQRGVKTKQGAGGLWTLESTDSPWPVEFAVHDDVLLIGVGENTVAEAIARMDAGTEARPRSGAARCYHDHDVYRVDVNIGAAVQRYANRVPGEVRKILRDLGFDKVRGVTMAARIEGENFVSSTFYDSPGGQDILTRWLSLHPVDLEILESLPEGTSAFSVFTLDPAWFMQKVRKQLPAELTADYADVLDNLEENVLPAFGPQCAQVTLEGLAGILRGPELVLSYMTNTAWMIQVRDRKQASHVLSWIPEQLGTPQKFKIGDADAVTFRLPDQRMRSFGLTPSFALTDDQLIVALTERTLRAFVAGGTKELGQRLRGHLDSVPESVAGVSWDSFRQGPGIYIGSMLAGIQQARMVSGVREFERALQSLPPALAYTTANVDGIFSYLRSPTGFLGSIGGVCGVAIVASIAIPNLLNARVKANEAAAIATLRNIEYAQEVFRGRAVHDEDNNGAGEFGFLGDLMSPAGRPALIPRMPGSDGRYLRSGYIFRAFLPGKGGVPIGESKRRGLVYADLAVDHMVVLAWPVERGKTGNRAFLLDAEGNIYTCADSPYGGRSQPPPDILCSTEGNLTSRKLPAGTSARDGHRWHLTR